MLSEEFIYKTKKWRKPKMIIIKSRKTSWIHATQLFLRRKNNPIYFINETCSTWPLSIHSSKYICYQTLWLLCTQGEIFFVISIYTQWLKSHSTVFSSVYYFNLLIFSLKVEVSMIFFASRNLYKILLSLKLVTH